MADLINQSNCWSKINYEGYQGILCDLDDTLYDYDPCNKAGYAAARKVAANCFDMPGVVFDKYWKAGRQQVHHNLAPFAAGHSRLLYAQKLAEHFYGHTHPSFTLEIEEAYWSAFLERIIWNPDAEAFMQKATEAGLEVCIVTDLTAQIQHRKWLKLDLGRFARYMVSSEEAGYEKPSPIIFKLALEKLGMQPSEVLMIGDSMEKDIKGAEALGIRPFDIKSS
jgi:putative hydrolase of the HAD superfamily